MFLLFYVSYHLAKIAKNLLTCLLLCVKNNRFYHSIDIIMAGIV